MRRVAILGGGIAGLAAAYELEQQRLAGKALEWQLFERSGRLGGIVETTRLRTPDGEYVLEGGPDAWVTEKPWARELAEELGLSGEIITSRDEEKKTYIWLEGQLVAMPDRMRMMVPEDVSTLEGSSLFSANARLAYARELERGSELKARAPRCDESVASFVRRHFGEEVLEKIGAPLLSGVFGGDVAKLSVRAVMPAFVKMEAEYGSLIQALQDQAKVREGKPRTPTFTSLRRGMGSLVEAIVAQLPSASIHRYTRAEAMQPSSSGGWTVRTRNAGLGAGEETPFDEVLLALPIDAARELLQGVDHEAAALVPCDASSAILICFCWTREAASSFVVPPGFGFLVPQSRKTTSGNSGPVELLAGTFSDQKFPGRAPTGARVMRAFFGGSAADALMKESDAAIAQHALRQLHSIIPGLTAPEPTLTTVRRWPRSLPQYEVGHLERMRELGERIARLGHLHLLGNGYRGVGVPDLIRDARATGRALAAQLTST